MKWSFKLGTLAGIPVYVHVTFFLILPYVAYATARDQGTARIGGAILLVLALFGCIVLHELGHALTARRYGVKTRDIILLPIGGVARLERMPREPLQELWVAMAGPAVNVVIALILGGWLAATGAAMDPEAVSQAFAQGRSFLLQLLAANVLIVLFNLLPAFPMDGGRMLRALLATRIDYVKATRVAAGIGQVMAFLFIFGGLMGSPFLILIGLFVWIGASQESAMVERHHALAEVKVKSAMLTSFERLAPGDTLGHAAERLLAGSQEDFPVASEGGEVFGILRRNDLVAGLVEHGQAAPVTGSMCRDLTSAAPEDLLEPALERLQESKCRTLPVLDADGRLVGLLTLDNVRELLMIRSALSHPVHPAGLPRH
ncbi:MAG: site-2 protease family protein [Acidobacteria bacterium]|nr:site-2 protease family protein [Acidobacteriota bacterium]